MKIIISVLFGLSTLLVHSQMSSLSDTTPGDVNGKHGWGIPPPPTYTFDYVKAAQVYWKYRYRLVGDYVTSDSTASMGEPGFLIRGQGVVGSGLSSPARKRVQDVSGSNNAGWLYWNDGQGDDLGKYLAVLATEWRLLQVNGESSTETNNQLYYAMSTFNRLEQTFYQEYGYTAPYGQNGIFFRDDVPGNLGYTSYTSPSENPPYGPNSSTSNPYYCFGNTGQTAQNSNYYQYVSSAYQSCTSSSGCGCPDHQRSGTNAGVMSKDQAIKMIWGLAFVAKCIQPGDLVLGTTSTYPGYDVGYEAQNAMSRIINYISGATNNTCPLEWYIYDPNCSLVCQGNNCIECAWGMCEAGQNYINGTTIGWSFLNADAYLNAGLWAYFEGGLAHTGGHRPLGGPDDVGEYEGLLLILDGPQYLGWKRCIANYGNTIGFPYLDLASGFFNDYGPHQSQSHWQSLLTNPPLPASGFDDLYYPNVWPCELPLMDYTVAQGTSSLFWNSHEIGGTHRPAGEQYNGLDYMLFYNLYVLHYPSNFLDVATNNMVTYCDLQDRVVTATYPLAALSSAGSTIGTAATHLFVGAETSMNFDGAVINSPAYVDFEAPHLGAPTTTTLANANAYPNNLRVWFQYGSVATLTPGRPPCGSAVIPGTSTEYKQLYQNDTTDANLPDIETYLHYVDSLKAANIDGSRFQSNITDSSLQDIGFTLNVYPNPLSSECKISLSMPTAANVSMEVDDAYGKQVATVLSETNLDAGKYEYIFERLGLADGTYLLTIYVNREQFTRKLIII